MHFKRASRGRASLYRFLSHKFNSTFGQLTSSPAVTDARTGNLLPRSRYARVDAQRDNDWISREGEERDRSGGDTRGSTGIDRGRVTFIVTRCLRYWTTTAIYPIEYPTSLGSIGSRKGTMKRRERGGGARRVHPRSKAAHARSPSLWITALIESLSDVPWSRVILLPKQLLSSVVYSHLFHLAEPAPPTLLPLLHFNTSDLARSSPAIASPPLWRSRDTTRPKIHAQLAIDRIDFYWIRPIHRRDVNSFIFFTVAGPFCKRSSYEYINNNYAFE